MGILIAYFLGVLTVIYRKSINSVGDGKKATSEHDYVEPPSSILRAELQIPEAIKTESKADSNRNYRIQKWLTVGTWLAFVAAAVYAGIAARQLEATKRQTRLLEQQLESATACTISREFRITWPNHNVNAHLSILMQNKGKVACSAIVANFQMTELNVGNEVGRTLPSWAFDVAEIAASQDAPTEKGIYVDGIRWKDLDGINNLPKAIRVRGTFDYWNGFRKKSELVCVYVIGTFHSTKESMGETSVSCDGLPRQIAWYSDRLSNSNQH